MEKYKRITLGMLLVQLFIILTIVFFFQVDNMTLGQGDVYSFDTGWTMTYPDGKLEQIEVLPYHSTSKAGDVLILENKIPEQYYGKTIFFLSADKELVIRMDGEEIYSFGKNDSRLFGHTPGSVYNFVDIPYDCKEGVIQIEMVSAYNDYATYLSNFRIANRDVAILKVLRENLFNILCCVILAFSGILLIILGVLQHLSRKNEQGMLYLGILLMWAATYYSIETKILHIVFGNQTMYSSMIFLFLMTLPILLILYYIHMDFQEEQNSFRFILILAFCNMIIQMLLQVLNIKDFMNMAFFSHTLIFMTILVVLVNYIKLAKRKGKGTAWLEMIALLLMASGSIIDLFRTYTIYVGDLGKYSRYATTVYGLIMIFNHIRQIVREDTEEIEENERYLEQEVERKTEQIRSLLLQTINALSNAVDAKDYYTNGHSKRVAYYSKMLAERLGMDSQEQDEVYFAGLMHDIGKIRIPDEIIKKEDKLTDEEFDYIKLHPVSGYHILKGISALTMIADGAKYHHERYDGKGYPNRLTGDNIPLVAQIIGVADAYDAMTSNRCYRGALPQEVVRQEIAKGRGTQFNPEIADIMLKIIDEDTDYNLKQSELHQKYILIIADENMQQTITSYIMQKNTMYHVIGCAHGK